MWLLNAHNAELKFFTGPDDVPGGYAILSHVWGEPHEEDTFQSVQRVVNICKQNAGIAAHNTPYDPLFSEFDPRDRLIASLSTQVRDLTGQVRAHTAQLQMFAQALHGLNPTIPSIAGHSSSE